MDLIRLPRRFLDDHDERMCDNEEGIPLVERVRETARFAWVRRDDPGLADLRNDAEYYAASAVPGGLSEGYEWTGRAAKTLLRVLDEASAKKAETVACPYCEGTGRRLGSMLPCNDPNGCKGSGRLPPLGIPGGGR